MRLLFASLVAVPLLALACSSFTTGEAGTAPDGGAPDSGAPDASLPPPGTPVRLAAEGKSVRALSVAGDKVAWEIDDRTIRHVDLVARGEPSTLALAEGRTQSAFAIDATDVFWLEHGGTEPGGRVMQVPLAASGKEPTTLVTGKDLPNANSPEIDLFALGPKNVAAGLSTGATGVFGKNGSPSGGLTFHASGELVVDSKGMTYRRGSDDLERILVTSDQERKLASGITPSSLVATETTIYALVPGAIVAIPNEAQDVDGASDTLRIYRFEAGLSAMLASDGRGSLVLWTSDGTLARVDPTSGTPTELQKDVHQVTSLAASPRGVFWTTEQGDVSWLTP